METIKHVITSPLLWMAVGVVVGCYGWLHIDEPHGVITMVVGGALLIGSFAGLLLTSDLARFRIKVAILIVCVTAVVVSVWFIQNSMFVPVSWLVLLVAAPLALVIGVSLIHRVLNEHHLPTIPSYVTPSSYPPAPSYSFPPYSFPPSSPSLPMTPSPS